MPSGVRVRISDRAIISALNEPGGGVYKWRDEIGKDVKARAEGMAPENDPMNAEHRGGEVGLYKASFNWDRLGSAGHRVIARVENTAPHAVFVELGLSGSRKMQIFSWTEYGGATVRIGGPSELTTDEKGNKVGTRRKLSRGELAFNKRIGKLPKRIASATHGREGKHILRRALVGSMGSAGFGE